jgi:hypothetical protein
VFKALTVAVIVQTVQPKGSNLNLVDNSANTISFQILSVNFKDISDHTVPLTAYSEVVSRFLKLDPCNTTLMFKITELMSSHQFSNLLHNFTQTFTRWRCQDLFLRWGEWVGLCWLTSFIDVIHPLLPPPHRPSNRAICPSLGEFMVHLIHSSSLVKTCQE